MVMVTVQFFLSSSTTERRDDDDANNNKKIEKKLPLTITQKNNTLTEILERQKRLQIENYKKNKALMFHIHVTHHGGTSFCNLIGRKGGSTPEFVCMGPNLGKYNLSIQEYRRRFIAQSRGDNNNNNNLIPFETWPPNVDISNWYLSENPNDTTPIVNQLRQKYHMVASEFHSNESPRLDLNVPELLSVTIMRHPLDRFLAKGKCGSLGSLGKKINLLETAGKSVPADLWWNYAHESCADNYALRVYSGRPLAWNRSRFQQQMNGKQKSNIPSSPEEFLQLAKDNLNRYTFVLDLACLDISMMELGQRLGIDVGGTTKNPLKRLHKSARERINNDTLYSYLEERFRYDIELYEWSKTISLVNCAKE